MVDNTEETEFLGLMNYYCRFLPYCATILQPLHDLLGGHMRPSVPLPWAEAATAAFENLKVELAKVTLLAHSVPNRLTSVMVDASDVAVGAVLQQFVTGLWQPLPFFSKKMTAQERCYSTFGGALLAIYFAVKHFCHYL